MSEALAIGLGVGIPATLIIGLLSYLSIPRNPKREEGPLENIIHTDERGNRNSADMRYVLHIGGKQSKSRKHIVTKSRKNKK